METSHANIPTFVWLWYDFIFLQFCSIKYAVVSELFAMLFIGLPLVRNIQLGKGSEKKILFFYGLLPNRGGGVAEGSKKTILLF